MTHDLILTNIARHIKLDEQEIDYFTSLLIFKEIPRKQLILQEGQPCNFISYVHSGALRAFYIGKEGKESTIMFAVKDWWVTDMFCFLNSKPAMMNIEAIADSCIFQLDQKKFQRLFDEVPKFERFFRILMQNAYTREQLRIIENLSMTAEARYDSFLVKYSHIAKAITQKQMASYLGITAEFLSAIKKRKSKKKIS